MILRRVRRGATESLVLALALFGASPDPGRAQPPEELLVFAAASTTDLLHELAARFEAERGVTVRVSLASSSTLARQIEHGAPADVFVSADAAWMDALERGGALAPGTRFAWMSNRIALVAPRGAPLGVTIAPGLDLAGALGGARLALADPTHVPAGRYAAAALRSLGVWDELAGRRVHAVDVRAALALVERGEVGAGLVYVTDALATERVRLVGCLPRASHPVVVYPVAILGGRDRPLAHAFVAHLKSDEARAAITRHGFLPWDAVGQQAAAGGPCGTEDAP